jgi:nicotinate-nucleotide--dimethylbenzimidazole phosphoribosyltransferase
MKEWFLDSCALPDPEVAEQALERQMQLTKPPGSLGQLEQIAVSLSSMQGKLTPTVDRVEIAVFAGDHGIATEGVSAFPPAVTVEMVRNFVRGGAAISVMAKHIKAGLTVINAGTSSDRGFEKPVVDRPVAFGTGNITREPAMTYEQCIEALALGKSVIDGYEGDTELVIGGEMGIGNTSSATALAAALGVSTAARLVGPGTGLDSDGVAHKLQMIEKALDRPGRGNDAISILADLGGFEIAALSGYYLRAAQQGIIILIDGFISSVAALASCQINPAARDWMLFSHQSTEPGHVLVLEALSGRPMLALEMRLGEGSGAAVAVSLLRSACALHNEMATFAEAGVSDG